MRGKDEAFPVVQPIQRITPAYAGKSVYGVASGKTLIGSPPPMRGKGKLRESFSVRTRITPAYAGKRSPQIEC